MTYIITHGCCSDTSCIPVCPVQCIRPRPGDPDFTTAEQLYIDPATCIDCGACMDECPVNAIHPEWDLPEELDEYLAVNADYFSEHPIEESAPVDQPRRVLPEDKPELRVAIVGSGPAGCYAASALTDVKGVSVSMLDRLPTPFGLVRAGVAPDHVDTKQIAKRFSSVLSRSSVQCFFNVEVGQDISIEEVLEHHHALIWAVGARDDRKLGIAGEELGGVVSAREFVAWYNGHPAVAARDFDLSGERVVVIGNGNVALDVARILARPDEDLAKTDISDHALEALSRSAVSDILITARRGPEHASFSSGELSGLMHTDGVTVRAVQAEVSDLAEDTRTARLLHGAAQAAEGDGAEGEGRNVTFRFGLTPQRFEGTDQVEAVTFAAGDGEGEERVEATLVIRAIGYRGHPLDGLPFDEARGTAMNEAGRVVEVDSGDTVTGHYCTGWFKRGATGMIGTNKTDSMETVEALFEDFSAGVLNDPIADLEVFTKLVEARQPDVVDKQAWSRIDQAERSRGRQARRPRQKFISVEEMLEASRAAS